MTLEKTGLQEAKKSVVWDILFLRTHHSLIMRVLLKNIIHPSKFKNLIGFNKWFMNWAPCHLATGRTLQGLYKMESRRVKQEGISKRKGRTSVGGKKNP